MYNTTARLNSEGRYNKVHTTHDGIITGPLTPKRFQTSESTQQFVSSLQTQVGCWQYLVSQCNSPFTGLSAQHSSMEQQVSQLLLSGQVKLYPITLPKLTDSSPKRRTIKGGDRVNYQFTPVANMLITKPREVKKFHDKASADAFLAELNPDEEQLKSLATELDIPISSTAAVNPVELTDSITTAMASGEVVIIVDRISGAPPGEQQEEQGNSVGHRNMEGQESSGDSESEKNKQAGATEQDKKPDCIYKRLTLTCQHGRSITLDPSSLTKDDDIPRLQIVSCQNEKLKDKDGQPIFEILDIDAEIDSVCPSHQTSFISINDSDVKLIGSQSNGKLAKFKSPSRHINIGAGSSVLKYLWLPNVEQDGVRTYKVFAVESCDFSQFKDKSKYIQVDVFPHMKWSLSFNINLGQIKNDEKPSKRKLGFAGSLKLEQDKEEADEFTVDYKKKLEVFEDTLDNFKNILYKHIFSRFSEGRDIEFVVDLPKVVLDYSTQFKEKAGSPLVVRTHEFTFQAAPFVAITASVDILPVIVKLLSSWWSSLFNVFFDWVKQKRGKKDGQAYIEANVSFKLSIQGDLGGKFTHSCDESNETKLTGEPVTSKIKLSVEGEAKLDGHVYVVKVQVVLKAGLESSIDLGLSMGSDDIEDEKDKTDNAPYISLDFMFNGIKLYLEKEVQFRLDKNTNEASSINDDMFNDVVDEALPEGSEIGTKEIKRSEPRVWLKMSDKHQFKYYLKEEDRLKIQSKEQLEDAAAEEKQAEQEKRFNDQMQAAKEKDKKLTNDLKQRIFNDPPKAL